MREMSVLYFVPASIHLGENVQTLRLETEESLVQNMLDGSDYDSPPCLSNF